MEKSDQKNPSREDALKVLKKCNKADHLIKHALAVEAVMRYSARKHGENEDKWGVVGLIHDVDYELYPQEHCLHIRELLEKEGWPEEYIRAAESHGWQICTDVEPLTTMEKTLYAIDELTGLVTATALVRPSKSVLDMAVKSVKKKWNTKAFSAGVDRSVIEKGANMLGLELSELINDTIMGMREVAAEIDLKGNME